MSDQGTDVGSGIEVGSGPRTAPGSEVAETVTAPHVVVVGGGLAGMSAALGCADAGARVTLLEKRSRLGGLTWSFDHDGLMMDNGQHVFLRCCTAYLSFLDRIGSAGDVELQDRLNVSVLRPGGATGTEGRAPRSGTGARAGTARAVLRRDAVPAPLHLARSLLGYGLVPPSQRARLGIAALALARLDLNDPALDTQTFASWLAAHGQGQAAIAGLWDLICLPTVNLPAHQASLAMAAKVFQTGLLTDSAAGDIGWSRVPLGMLHGERGAEALRKAGAQVHLAEAVREVAHAEGPARFVVRTASGELDADAVIAALPHYCTEEVLPVGSLPEGVRPSQLGSSPIVNVHVRFERRVMDLPLAAALGTMAQWVFDRTASAGAAGPAQGQYLTVSLSGADAYIGQRPEQLADQAVESLRELFPAARSAAVLSTFVTREHHATFRAVPGSAAHRAPARSRLAGLALAGAWTSTGWPPTMEGAVRSGTAAARTALVSVGKRRDLPRAAA
jgi:squalene-associated FAD-dependent desaturase